MKVFKEISKNPHLDVLVQNAGFDKTANIFLATASITHFKPRETEQGAEVLKKVTIGATGKTLEDAQNSALTQAISLMGLEA